MLEREEYVEQAYLFRTLRERLLENMPMQELLQQMRDEVLATTRLPMALDFLLTELKHLGIMSPAMARLSHYFTPFQTYVMKEAENERGRFDMRIALEVLQKEAHYRSGEHKVQGVFLYQFETLCRNRMRYDHGLKAVAEDPIYDENWRQWIMEVRMRIGIIEFPDMLYVRSAYYNTQQELRNKPLSDVPVLFGENEGRIALANRKKDPLFLFAALQRHLAYPAAPRIKVADENVNIVPLLVRRMERAEARLKLLEEEQRNEGIDLEKFYRGPDGPPDAEF